MHNLIEIEAFYPSLFIPLPFYYWPAGEEKSQKKASLKKALNSNFSISSVQETKPSRGVRTNKLIRDGESLVTWWTTCNKHSDH